MRNTIFTLATVVAPKSDNEHAKECRCIGWFSEPAKAVEAIEMNLGDLWEGMYTHAVIEEHEEGIYGNVSSSIRWFEAVYEDGKFEPVAVKEVETPPWAINVFGWGIG